jgi:heat-inducible transcriptional repressor
MKRELNHRAKKILQAVVAEYLNTGEAVGSRRVTRRQGIDLSPATVRNVMADLEEMGLLEQPHTSAGRVPTGTGLRFFIDSLLRVRGLSPREKEEIRGNLGASAVGIDELMQRTSRALSEITRYAGIVLVANPARQRLRHIEFVPLGVGRYLCILVTSEGRIENKLVESDLDIDPSQLESIHRYLAELLGGLTLDEVRQKVLVELGLEKNAYDQRVAAALRLSMSALEAGPSPADVIVSGQANLVESADISGEDQKARLQELLRALEEKELLVRLLDQTLVSERIQVFLGAETRHEALGDSSVVAVPYGPDAAPVGAIAVIGPTRMNYGKVMSIVDFTADVVSELLGDS